MLHRFDVFTVDTDACVLRQDDRELPLRPKHVEVLALLILKRPNIVPTQDILAAVWGGDGEDGYVANAISEIRRYLNDDSLNRRYIRNVYGKGYAFIYTNVHTLQTASAQPLRPTKYGISARAAVSNWQVLDGDGTLKRIQRIEGFRVEGGVSLNQIEGHSDVWTPGCSIKQRPTLRVLSSFPKRTSLVLEEPLVPSRMPWRLVIAGGLTDHDPPLDYEIVSVYDRGVLMSNAAVAAAYANDEFKYDYLSWDATLPVDTVSISVLFPRSIRAKSFPGVFWGQTEWFFHHVEVERIKSGFAPTPFGATLTIAQPTVGFRYFIYWIFEE